MRRSSGLHVTIFRTRSRHWAFSSPSRYSSESSKLSSGSFVAPIQLPGERPRSQPWKDDQLRDQSDSHPVHQSTPKGRLPKASFFCNAAGSRREEDRVTRPYAQGGRDCPLPSSVLYRTYCDPQACSTSKSEVRSATWLINLSGASPYHDTNGPYVYLLVPRHTENDLRRTIWVRLDETRVRRAPESRFAKVAERRSAQQLRLELSRYI